MKKTKKRPVSREKPQKRLPTKPVVKSEATPPVPQPPGNNGEWDLAHDCCFDAGRGAYWMQNDRGIWITLNETQFKRELRENGVSPHVPKNAYNSPLDSLLLRIQHTEDVHYANPLAGYKSGIREMCGRRILVTESPQLVDPWPGDWPVLRSIINGMLQDEKDQEFNQTDYLYGWLKVATEALRKEQPRVGQAIVFVGPHDCGKSLLQNLFTVIFGGRSISPYQAMTGATSFNSDLFEAEHLTIEDEAASNDIRARRFFGSQIKVVTANDRKRCHAKYRIALTLMPFWRLSISVNDEPENLMVLPPIDDSIEDKLIILRACPKPMPMPAEKPEERAAFWSTLVEELPAFVDFLLGWKIPRNLASDRYGVTHFHHPEILQAIDMLAPEFKLLSLVDGYVLRFSESPEKDWKGTAEELERLLTGDNSGCRLEARKLLNWNTACGVYLGRLARKFPGRFSVRRAGTVRRWTIKSLLEGATVGQ